MLPLMFIYMHVEKYLTAWDTEDKKENYSIITDNEINFQNSDQFCINCFHRNLLQLIESIHLS